MEEKRGSPPKATFVVRIHFRRNSTWQGTVTWADTKRTQNFRSALELVRLMDSAMHDSRQPVEWKDQQEES